jgi:2-haloalkanoic acid dehalogenase type II
MSRRYDAVLFDLLTALLDSWSLWTAVAGSEESGRSWRAEYLRMTYEAGRYRPYEDMVREAAGRAGLAPRSATELTAELASRYGELEPWPGAVDALTKVRQAGVPLGIVTNCSEELGRVAVSRVPIPFNVVVTAERAGFYKPDPHPYRLALQELGVLPERCLFVAGSAYDLVGTARVGLPTFWHDRIGMELPQSVPEPMLKHRDLAPLVATVLA